MRQALRPSQKACPGLLARITSIYPTNNANTPPLNEYGAKLSYGTYCYGGVKMIRFSYSNEDTKDEEKERV
jgi:hypothetical protein